MIPNAWSGFDFGLGDEVDMLRKTAEGFAQDKIAPRADEIDRTNTFPLELWPELGRPAREPGSDGDQGAGPR